MPTLSRMLPELAAAVAAVRRRRFLAGWLELASVHVALALFALGAFVLYRRGVEGAPRAEVARFLGLSTLGLVTAALVARKRVPGRAWAAAWLDVQAGASGVVVTEDELGSSAWSPRARAALETARAALPRPALGPALKRLAPAALFAGLALWVPISRDILGPPPVIASALIEELETKLQTLTEELELPPDEALELEERLERLQAEAETGQPASTFEAVDRLGERLEDEAARALEAAQRAAEDLAAAAGQPELSAAQEALESALATLKDAGLTKDLPPAALAGLQPGSLTLPPGTQLSSRELAALSRELRQALEQRVGALAAGKLLDPARLRAFEGRLGALGEGFGEPDPAHECDEDCKKPGGT